MSGAHKVATVSECMFTITAFLVLMHDLSIGLHWHFLVCVVFKALENRLEKRAFNLDHWLRFNIVCEAEEGKGAELATVAIAEYRWCHRCRYSSRLFVDLLI